MAVSAMFVMSVACDKKSAIDESFEVVPSIKISPVELPVMNAAGGNINFSLTANLDWVISGIPDWLAVSPSSGEGSRYKQTVVLTAQPNKAGLREAVLTVSVDGLSKDIKVIQNHSFGSDAPENAIYYEPFTSSIGAFTINDVNVPQELPCVWEYTGQYKCMKATAYANPSNYASESWLISPEIEMPSGVESYFTFEHAGGYFGNASNEATVWVSKNGGDWEELEIESKNYPTSWTFISAGNWDMDAYAGSKIQIAFRYSSTATKAGTWEVRNVAILSGEYTEAEVPVADPTKADWMELPAMNNSSYGYYAHHFSMKNQVYRNYSFAWSQQDLVSVWVAYPLCKTYTEKNVDRTDAWAYDPILGSELSAAPFSYYAGDYARGHQLPSADRLCCKEANEQTFYGTNIIPQLNEHNEGLWQNLENHIRTIANASDTTYVVTGGVVQGSNEITEDSDGKSITVPVAFFKAVLRYKKSDSANVWSAAGFYTEHKNYGGQNSNLKAVSMSIDELETKTGFDFFVNLAAKIGADNAAAVEAQDPATSSVWGL